MLNLLHKKISEIVSINGLSYDENKQLVVDYVTPPSENELQLVNDAINNWPTEILKYNALKNLEQEWASTISNGWTTPFGWKLGLDIQDVTLLTGAFMLAKEAASLGVTDPVSIVDTSGNVHSLTLEEMTTLMLQYGQARAFMSEQYANNRVSILESVTPDDIDQATTTTTSTTVEPALTTSTTPLPMFTTTSTTIEPNNDR